MSMVEEFDWDNKQLGPEIEKPQFCVHCGANTWNIGTSFNKIKKTYHCNRCNGNIFEMQEFNDD